VENNQISLLLPFPREIKVVFLFVAFLISPSAGDERTNERTKLLAFSFPRAAEKRASEREKGFNEAKNWKFCKAIFSLSLC